MPPRGTITKKRRHGLMVYSYAVEANPPGTTHEQLHKWVVERAAKWSQDLGWRVPDSMSRASDYIREITRARAWLDDPWHLGIFATHRAPNLEIPGDALLDVMAVALRCFAGGKRLTARQALWVARLRPLLGPIRDGTSLDVENAYGMTLAYSARERAAAALAEATGMQEPPIPPGHESDTWPLDVITAISGGLVTVLGETGALGAAVREGLLDEPIWPVAEWLAVPGPITDTEATLPLRRMLLKVAPSITQDWRTLSAALLHLRAIARTERWESMTNDDREREALRIGDITLAAAASQKGS